MIVFFFFSFKRLWVVIEESNQTPRLIKFIKVIWTNSYMQKKKKKKKINKKNNQTSAIITNFVSIYYRQICLC